jgi:methylase of polypeptide subunit release factors
MVISSQNFDYSKIRVCSDWNTDKSSELKIHRIHAYPAKFPAFLVSKAIELAKEKNIDVKKISDIFCGCGTTAFEAKRNNIDFLGYDINPVATLIAKVKSNSYQIEKIEKYFKQILEDYSERIVTNNSYSNNDRILYWFEREQIYDLTKLLSSIKGLVPKGKYLDFFLCGFSNILKPASRWLTKSIKPQVDPQKESPNVLDVFTHQVQLMIKAIKEQKVENKNTIKIQRRNILDTHVPKGTVDLLISSPPYVTSYEYADLHQLSLLWLGYTDDYRKMRNGSIGSVYHQKISQDKIDTINDFGKRIFNRLNKVDKSKAYSVAKYFIDLKRAIEKSYELLCYNGMAFFVIGNTSYKKVRIDNVKYLVSCLVDENFEDIEIIKRKISSKILTPYRNEKGRFSNNSNYRKVYQYEYIIIARKQNANN